MDWTQFAIFLFTMGGLFLWNRAERRNDIRHIDSKIEAIRNLTVSFHEAIRQDTKDFHGRLCDLEARRK